MKSGLKPSGCGATTRVIGLFRLNPAASFSEVSLGGEAMAPAKSWEKEKGPWSEKKLETRDIGPGLKPMPLRPLENRDSAAEPRGGTAMVAGLGLAAATAPAASATLVSPIDLLC